MSDDGLHSIQLSDADEPKSRRRSNLTKALISLGVLLLVLVGGGFTAAYLASEHIGNSVRRIPNAFGDIPETSRPVRPTTGHAAKAMNILLAGSDLRASGQTTGKDATNSTEWESGGQRTDAIMLVHIAGDRKSAYVMSIPRDSWVTIPGYGKNKINAAYSYGGPSLFIRTIEKLTNVHIDHLAFIDWDGFESLTNALGGVDLTLDTQVRGVSGATYGPGTVHLDGKAALDYVRERHSVPGGDFGRQKRQQNFLRAVMHKMLSQGTLKNPLKLTKALDAIANNLSVDDTFTTGDMRGLALSLRNIRSNDVTFLSVPNAGTGMEGSQSVVYLDAKKCDKLWKAIRSDDVGHYIAANGADTLGTDVR
jgi:LCP family protein required for cell wall assembly